MPAAGDPRAGLTKIGRDYAALLSRPQMVALFRLVIAEAPRVEVRHEQGRGRGGHARALWRGPGNRPGGWEVQR